MLFRKLGWMDEVFAAKMNKFVFLVPLPVLLFEQLATVDFSEAFGENLSRRLTGAVRRFLELLLSRIFTELREWHRL